MRKFRNRFFENLSTFLGLTCCSTLALAGPVNPGVLLSDRSFYIHDLGHRCLDFGAQTSWAVGGPVYTYSCNGSVSQQVRITEIDASHDVQLRVQSFFCIGVWGGHVVIGQPLELQVCDLTSPAQRFALDGDTILMGIQSAGQVSREYTIQPQFNYTTLRTPLVVGTREASDAEYFVVDAVDKSTARPTSGFVVASSEAELDSELSLGWGTVIEIDPKIPLVLKGTFPKQIHAGVTLRGYRKYIFQGPDVHVCTSLGTPAFEITENNVRITGLRLHGPVSDTLCQSVAAPLEASAISVDPYVDAPASATGGGVTFSPHINACSVAKLIGCSHVPRVLIDHLDISFFTGSGVQTGGTDRSESQTCPPLPQPFPRDTPVRVIGNFIHHNGAYGTVTGNGAFVLNQGNVFYLQHAHAIASDPWGTTGYNAYDNFILSEQHNTHSIDMHGSLEPGHWQGGLSGDYYDVGWNTILQTNHFNVDQRGTPCRFTAIHDNIFVLSRHAALVTATTIPDRQSVYANTFNAPNPTEHLAVGDFDGDGIDDVFVGTGAAWYFSSGGQSEWRFLNRMPEHADSLLFGDFDGDGRTDIIALHGSNIDVSWGGISRWQTINVTAGALSDMAVGDFDGDRRADLFLATGTQWFYAPAGKNWTPLAFSSYRTSDLRFGDFTHQGRTQVLRIAGGQWQVAGLGTSWRNIGSASGSTLTGLVVGDFDGNGYADVARTNSIAHRWEYATPAAGAVWKTLRTDSTAIALYPIGRFNGDRTSDILFWNDLHFSFAASGQEPLQPLSRQDMR